MHSMKYELKENQATYLYIITHAYLLNNMSISNVNDIQIKDSDPKLELSKLKEQVPNSMT